MRVLLALSFLFLLSVPSRAAEPDPIRELEHRVVERTLSDGLKVIILRRPVAPLVSFNLMFHAGGVDEVSGKTGLAHLFEHMMFKGTKTIGTKDYAKEKPILDAIDRLERETMAERRKGAKADAKKLADLGRRVAALEKQAAALEIPAEFDEIYEREGGEGLNAFTSQDMTGFVVSLPSNRWELWPVMEADRMANPVLREFYKERDVVMEERLMRFENSPSGKLWENFVSAAFQAHPYHTPTIGWISDIRDLDLEDARAFYKSHYSPNNAAVAIVGDVDPDRVVAELEKRFASVRPHPLPEESITTEPPQAGERRVTVEYDAEPSMMMGFHKPQQPDPDDAAMDVIGELLNRGRSARFNRDIVEKGIALEAYASNGEPGERYPNLVVFGGSPRSPHGNADLEKAIWYELDRLKREDVSGRDLLRIRNGLEADYIRNLSSNSGMANELVYNQVVLGDWRQSMRYLDRLRKVTPADIRRVAAKYFTEENCTVAYLQRAPGKKP